MNFALLQIGWVNDGAITAAVEKFSPDDWLKKHAFISEEDFTKDRNRLAVFLNRFLPVRARHCCFIMQYQHPDLEYIRTALNVTRARTEQENRIN